MANVVTLALFKKHVRADDFADDDTYLQHLLDVAEEAVITATNRTEAELTEMGGGSFPASLKHAIMLLGGHLYNQRESVSTTQLHAVPDSLQALIKPWRKLVNTSSDDSGTDEA